MEETSDETAEDQSPLWVTGTEGQFIKKKITDTSELLFTYV